MKKIFIILLSAMLIFALPVVAFAEEGDSATATQNGEVTENSTPENEIATEGEISPPEKTVTESIVDYVKDNIEEIVVIVAMALGSFYEARVRGKMNGTIGVLNNNAISVATSSAEAINKAIEKAEAIAGAVEEYRKDMTSVIEEIRKTAEEKETIEQMLLQVDAHLKTAKLANVEFANELAELLNLANIPNSKKDEIFARHNKSIHELEAVEEVMSHDGKEA